MFNKMAGGQLSILLSDFNKKKIGRSVKINESGAHLE